MNKELGKKILIYVAIAIFSAMTGNILPIGNNGNIDLSILVESSTDQYGKVTESILSQALRPMMETVMEEGLEPILEAQGNLRDDVAGLIKSNEAEITARAVGAYTKVFTIEDLNDSPEKRYSITAGLNLESCYDTLLIIDRERTKMFYNYLIRDAP